MNEGGRSADRREPERGEEFFSLEVNQPLAITVDNPNGRVAVRATDGAELVVRHAKIGAPGAAYDAAELVVEMEVEPTGARLRVRPVLPPSFGGGARSFVGDAEGLGGRNAFKGPRGVDVGRVMAEAGRVVIEASRACAGTIGNGVRYDLEIEVPPTAGTTTVNLKTASGDVLVEAITGSVSLRTASGDAVFDRVRGAVIIETASGDVALRGSVGAVSARTASGDLLITGCELPAMEVKTASGDVGITALIAGAGPFRIETVSGDVRLDLAGSVASGAESNLALAFRTVSGDARVEAPFRVNGRRAWRLGSGTLGPEVSVKTVSGDLAARVSETWEVPPVPTDAAVASSGPPSPMPPSPMPPSPGNDMPHAEHELADDELATVPETPASVVANERLRLLQAVERGEIDVEEALRQLDEPTGEQGR